MQRRRRAGTIMIAKLRFREDFLGIKLGSDTQSDLSQNTADLNFLAAHH